MTQVKRDEIPGILDRGMFNLILHEDVPDDENVLPVSFILSIISSEDGEMKFKARYVIGGHLSQMKNIMVHSATALHPQSIRFLLAPAAMFASSPTSRSDGRRSYCVQLSLRCSLTISDKLSILLSRKVSVQLLIDSKSRSSLALASFESTQTSRTVRKNRCHRRL